MVCVGIIANSMRKQRSAVHHARLKKTSMRSIDATFDTPTSYNNKKTFYTGHKHKRRFSHRLWIRQNRIESNATYER